MPIDIQATEVIRQEGTLWVLGGFTMPEREAVTFFVGARVAEGIVAEIEAGEEPVIEDVPGFLVAPREGAI